MEASLADIRNRIRFRGDFQNRQKFPDSDINTEIQTAFGAFWQVVDEENQGWWDDYLTVTSVVAQDYIALPSTVWSIKNVKRVEGSQLIDVDQIAATRRSRYSGSPSRPTGYFNTSRGLELVPAPDAAYDFRILYTPRAPKLSEDVKREWYNGWDDYVVACVILELARREMRPLGDYETKVQMAEKTLRTGAGKRREQEPEYLNLREGWSGDSWDDGIY